MALRDKSGNTDRDAGTEVRDESKGPGRLVLRVEAVTEQRNDML